MTVAHVTWLREVRAYCGALSCGLSVTAFLAAAGWSFVMLVRRHEGSVLQVQSLWGVAVAPWLPVLCSVLTMRLLAEERSSGMIELLMSAPVRERELVFGKYLAALTVVALALAFSALVPLAWLPAVARPLHGTVHAAAFAATYLILLLQAAAWCAAGLLASSLFRSQAASAVVSLLLCNGLPVGVYAAVLAWAPSLRMRVAWLPMLVHVYDFSTGLFSTAVIALYVTLAAVLLFVCSKRLALLRVRG